MLTWLRLHAVRASIRVRDRFGKPRRVHEVDDDVLPAKMPGRDLVLLTEGDEPWSVAMQCPCGCGSPIELPLIPEAEPRWDLRLDAGGLPTLHPSIWRQDGCRSHYFVRKGRIIWV